MNNIDENELLNALIKKAEEGKHSEIKGLRNIESLEVAFVYRKSLKKVIKIFKQSAEELLKLYIEYLDKDIDYLNLLFESNLLEYCREYYEEELKITNSIIEEYKNYLIHPVNLIKSYIFWYNRTDDEINEISKISK